MKKFLLQITRFSLLLIIAAVAVQLLLCVIIRAKSLNEVDNLEQTANVNADLVFLGSSRCWVQFDPAFFDDAFQLKSINIGVDGHSEIAMAELRLQNYLKNNEPPKFIILSFDPMMNADKVSANPVHKDYFSRYAFFSSKKNQAFVDSLGYDTAEKYIPLYALFKYKLLDDCVKSMGLKKYNPSAGHLIDKKWDTIHNPINGDMKEHYFKSGQIIAVTKALQHLKDLCGQRNIKLLCIQTPVYKSIHDEKAFGNTRLICQNLGIPFIDMNIPEFRNDINCFYSPNHLNQSGVGKMNLLLKNNQELNAFLKK